MHLCASLSVSALTKLNFILVNLLCKAVSEDHASGKHEVQQLTHTDTLLTNLLTELLRKDSMYTYSACKYASVVDFLV